MIRISKKRKVYFRSGDFNIAWKSFDNAYKKAGIDYFREQGSPVYRFL